MWGKLCSLLGVALGLVMALVTVLAALQVGMSLRQLLEDYVLTNLVMGFGFLFTGALLCWHRSGNPVGWIVLAGGLGHVISAVGMTSALWLGQGQAPVMLVRVSLGMLAAGWALGLGGLFMLALLLFPTGRLPSRHWIWWLGALLLCLSTVNNVVFGALARPGEEGGQLLDSPALQIGFDYPPWLQPANNLLGTAGSMIAVTSLFYRYARGTERTRRQLLWLLLATVIALLLNLQRMVTGWGPEALILAFVLNRSVLYASVFVMLMGIYAALVSVALDFLPAQTDRLMFALAAAGIAFAFSPVRALLERIVGRAFYGARNDVAAAAEQVGKLWQDGAELGALLGGVCEQLRLPGLRLTVGDQRFQSLDEGYERCVSEELELSGQGTLRVWLRPGENRLHPRDERMLQLVGNPLALLVRSRLLATALEQARAAGEQVRTEERRELHRELHDDVGPLLFGAALHIDAGANMVRGDPAGSVSQLATAAADVRQALAEVRQIAHGLRAVELSEYGLWEAIRRRAANNGTLRVRVQLPEVPPRLSAGQELGVYRVVGEALANIAHHSDGNTARLSITVRDNELHLTVWDNGRPPQGWSEGLGLSSLRQRVEDLGGQVAYGPRPDGWVVSAQIPLTTSGRSDGEVTSPGSGGAFTPAVGPEPNRPRHHRTR